VEGESVAFDGGDLGILNFNNKILMTHELLQEFLNVSCETRSTHKGWIRGKFSSWLRSQKDCDGTCHVCFA
jgi:hypothetical protein